jgi:serine/threonine-protein kinase
MVARFTLCQRRPLELAVAGQLPAAESQLLSLHLEGCAHCRAELEQLAGSDAWWNDARSFLSSTDELRAIDDDESGEQGRDVALEMLEPSESPGRLGRLGKYEVEEVVGRGGMGLVLKAEDTELSRPVAIKVLAGHLATSGAARKRFVKEARAAAAVVHDHVIPIHDIVTSERTPFLVMPYIAGPSLQDRLDADGPLETIDVLRIAMQTARGLAAAHAQGLVHRDIKPANILLENGTERVRITDFGLARAVDDASQTQSGFIAGTPQYMSPEQARGVAIDARADLFSLGSVIYAMCAGHPPFRAETTLAVLRRICDDAPRSAREANPAVPVWLAAIIDKLLAKSPADRFQSAAEVAALLERWLAHVQQPTVVDPPAVVVATNKKLTKANRDHWSRLRLPAAIVGVLLLAGGAAAVLQRAAAWKGSGDFGGESPRMAESRIPAKSPDPVAAASGRRSPSVSGSLEDTADAELSRAWQETLHVEAQLRNSTAESSFDAALSALDQRLSQLEQEFAPGAPPPTFAPAETRNEPVPTVN